MVQRSQFTAGSVLLVIGLVLIGLGIPLPSGQLQSLTQVMLTVGVSLTIVGFVLAVLGYSETNKT